MFPSMRTVAPEILDTLEAGHPDALRSRGDLRRLDRILGGTRWISRSVLNHRREAVPGIVEIGAGGGRLCGALAALLPGCAVTGLDFGARPACLKPGIAWQSGDIFRTLPGIYGGIVVGSLILHHFSDAALRALGGMLARFRVLLFSEPLRTTWSLRVSRLAHPFVGRVTRHDMPASIRAGFQRGELAALIGLSSSWKVSEVSRISGVLRFHAWRD